VTTAFRRIVEVELRAEIAFHQGRLAIDVRCFRSDGLLRQIDHLL